MSQTKTITYQDGAPQRVNRWLSGMGLCSRREAESWIAQGRLSIDGTLITAPGHMIEFGQTIAIKPENAGEESSTFAILIHKPTGMVSAHPMEDEYTAEDLLSPERYQGPRLGIDGTSQDTRSRDLRGQKIPPAGRLDKDSRGLLILSRDGVLTKAIIGDETDISKTYIVEVTGLITSQRIAKLRYGLSLDGRKLRRADVEQVGHQTLEIKLYEGRNRQIRRMCQLVGLRVDDLFRVAIGNVSLAGLNEGHWRYLSAQERAMLVGKP